MVVDPAAAIAGPESTEPKAVIRRLIEEGHQRRPTQADRR
jgi:hypothetical protein